ncbi:DMT family transporter [Dactylosporangium matsuzakiense]|uniref:DMT family transporter n=1 Tax=Dactylosporangium matsuzakiense TaxID=53360 RepID=UPI0021C3B5D6|nr:DMT family transporter [Dactylosporangium matsuzakiense]UWZ40903.1 DMT family transporter [Dactylosporangium matsuzakiense]
MITSRSVADPPRRGTPEEPWTLTTPADVAIRVAEPPQVAHRRRRTAPFAIVLAAAAWSTVGPAMAFLPASASPPGVVAARMAAGGALFVVVAGGRSMVRDVRATPRGVLLAVTAAVAMAGYQTAYVTAMHLNGVAVGTVVSMTSIPLFGGLLVAVTSGRRPSRVWLAATGAAAGASALLAGGADGRGLSALGVLCGLAAGLAYAVFTMASHTVIRRGCPSRSMMAAAFAGAGVLMSPLLVTARAWLATPSGVAVVGYLATVATVGAYVLFGRGLEGTPATTAATLVLVEPAFATVIGLLLLHEPATARTLAGLAAMALALALFTVRPRRAGRRPVRGAVPAQGGPSRAPRPGEQDVPAGAADGNHPEPASNAPRA